MRSRSSYRLSLYSSEKEEEANESTLLLFSRSTFVPTTGVLHAPEGNVLNMRWLRVTMNLKLFAIGNFFMMNLTQFALVNGTGSFSMFTLNGKAELLFLIL